MFQYAIPFSNPFTMESNPVFLYELRQIVRNQAILILFGLYLLGLVSFVGLAIIPDSKLLEYLERFMPMFSFGSQREPGSSVASNVLCLYYVFTTFGLTAFAAIQTANDRLNENPMFYSTLPPWRIVTGKLQFAAMVSLLFLSTTLPFLSIAYLLRGVDLLAVFLAALMLYCLSLLQFYVAVMFYAGASNMFRVVFFSIPMLFIQFLLSLFGIFAAYELAHEIAIGREGPELVLILALFFLAFMLVACVLSLVQFSPNSSNRMMPLRILLTAIQCCVIVAIIVSFFLDDNHWGGAIANLFFCFLIPYFFLVFICERVEYSPRIRRTIPKLNVLRLLFFPFYTGAPNAMVWCMLLFLLEIFSHGLISMDGRIVDSIWKPVWNGLSAGLLFFDYCATALLLYNLVFYRRYSRQMIWFPVFFGFVAVLVAFICILFSSFSLWKYEDMLFFLPNPLCVDGETFIYRQLTLAVVWLIVLAIPGVPWIVQHFNQFQPFEEEKEKRRPEAHRDGIV